MSNICTRSIPPLSLTTRLAVVMIRGYQRWISPYKGFRCAHRKLYGSRSCSEFALHEILDRGVRDAMPGIRNQFRECGAASRVLRRQKQAAMAMVASDGYELAPDEPDSEGPQTIDERIWDEQEKKRKRLAELPSNESKVTNCSDYAFFSCCTFEFAESFCCWAPW